MLKRSKFYQNLKKIIFLYGNHYIRIFCKYEDLNIDFLIGPFWTKKIAYRFAKNYLKKYLSVPLECQILNKLELKKFKTLPKFRQDRIKCIKFNENILNLHRKDFILGKILKIIPKEANIVDIGANTGLYSSAFAEFAKNVFAFEVSDPVLVQLIKTSKKFENIKIVQKAVNNNSNEAFFFIDSERFSNSGLIRQVESAKKKVQCIKLDDFFSNKFKIDLIKIDTEGTELNVLKGMQNILINHRPFVMIECWWKQSTYKHSDVFDYFIKNDYFCYANIRSCGLINIENCETFENLSYSKELSLLTDSDFLFSPRRLSH